MTGWIDVMNYVAGRLRRAVFALLIIAGIQALPGPMPAVSDTVQMADGSPTLRRPLD